MSSQANQPLPEGFQLENYRILRVLASGGFSFVYLAHDENETPVAIKEYLPATLALRTADGPAPVVPEENLATFRYGLKCFFEEGRALATPVAPQRGARDQFLPRQRDRLPGDALRARPHAAGAHPQEERADQGGLDPQHLRAAAERPARGAFQQAAAPGHQAGQHLRAQRRHPGADRFRRRAPDADGGRPEAAADVYAGLRLARAPPGAREARPLERHLLDRRHDVRLPGRRRPARRDAARWRRTR